MINYLPHNVIYSGKLKVIAHSNRKIKENNNNVTYPSKSEIGGVKIHCIKFKGLAIIIHIVFDKRSERLKNKSTHKE